jgi:hypothetical protein
MGNSGVGMLLGDTSVTALWMMFLGTFILGAAILYGVMKSGRLRRSERAQLDRNPKQPSAGTTRRRDPLFSRRRSKTSLFFYNDIPPKDVRLPIRNPDAFLRTANKVFLMVTEKLDAATEARTSVETRG